MRIALAQMNMAWEDKQRNKIKAAKMIENAKKLGAELVIFPEMTLTGFSFNTDALSEKTEGSDTISFFGKMSVENNINICFGMILKSNNIFFNKCFVTNTKGEIIADYSKIHPFSYSGEDKFFGKGENISVFKIGEISFSPFICYDLRFPEIFRISAEKVHCIIVIASWPQNRRNHWKTLLNARAIENQCYVIGVNRTGDGEGIIYGGDSCVFDFSGESILECENQEGIYTADIFPENVHKYRQDFPVLKDRRGIYFQ